MVHKVLYNLFPTPSISLTPLPANFPLIYSSCSELFAVSTTLLDTVILPQGLCTGSPLYLALFS